MHDALRGLINTDENVRSYGISIQIFTGLRCRASAIILIEAELRRVQITVPDSGPWLRVGVLATPPPSDLLHPPHEVRQLAANFVRTVFLNEMNAANSDLLLVTP